MENSTRISVDPSEIAVGNPALLRTISFHPQQGNCRGAAVIVSKSYILELLGELRILPPGNGAIIAGKLFNPQLVCSLQNALNDVDKRRPGFSIYLQGLLGKTLVEVLWHWSEAAVLPRSTHDCQLLSYRHFVQTVEYMKVCSKREFSVGGMCEAVGMSVAHFRRLIDASTDASPLDLYNQVLIARAQQLIETRVPVKEAAYLLGFSSPAQLGHLFRRYAGHAPGKMFKQTELMKSIL